MIINTKGSNETVIMDMNQQTSQNDDADYKYMQYLGKPSCSNDSLEHEEKQRSRTANAA